MPLILQSLSPLSPADLDAIRPIADASAFTLRAANVAAADDCAPLTPALHKALDEACADGVLSAAQHEQMSLVLRRQRAAAAAAVRGAQDAGQTQAPSATRRRPGRPPGT